MGKRKRALREYQDLQIRLRTELSGKGDSVSAQSVYCPRQRQSVSVYECGACPRLGSLFAGPYQDLVRCRVAGNPEVGYRSVREAADRLPVSNIMTNDVICVRPDVSIESLTTLLLERGFSGLPVVDEDGRAIGVVSESDLVRYQRELEVDCTPEELAGDALEPGFHADLSVPGSVAEVMTPVAFTVPEEASISSAATVMASRSVHRLPVVDSCGTVVGLLSSLDIVDWVAQGAPERLLRRGRDRAGD